MGFPVQLQRSAIEAPKTLTFAQEIQISFEALLDLFKQIAAFFNNIQVKKTDAPKIDPKEIPFSTPIHGMYALKSIRKIVETMHKENILNIMHKHNTSIQYSLFVAECNSPLIEISAQQIDCNGNILNEKKLTYTNLKLSSYIFRAQNESRLEEISSKDDLEIMIKYADKGTKESLMNKFFDNEREYEEEQSTGNYSFTRKFSGMDLIEASLADDTKESRKVKHAKSFLSIFEGHEKKACELISSKNFDLKGDILANSRKIKSCLFKPEVVQEQKVDQEQENDFEFERAMAKARAEVLSFMNF